MVSSTLSSKLQRVTYSFGQTLPIPLILTSFPLAIPFKGLMFSLIITPFFYRNPNFLLITFDLYRNSLSGPTAKQLITSSTILDTFTPHSYSFLWTFLYKRGSTSRDTFSLISSPVVRTSDSKVSPVNPTGEVSDQEECSYL